MRKSPLIGLITLLSPVLLGVSRAESPSHPSVFIVGDSVLSALAPKDTNFAQSIIGKNWDVEINAKPCRRATTPGCMKGGVPESVLDVLENRSSKKSSAVVVMIGHNDERNAAFQKKVQLINDRLAGCPRVFWVTMREISESYKRANQFIRADARKNVTVIDWDAASKTQPGWVASDGVHLKTAGARALATLIQDDLRRWKPAP
jgi:lysophospholipase L1-like esterase